MTTWVYLPLLLSVLLPWTARWMSTQVAPSTAARALTIASAATASAWICCLALLGLTLFDDLPPLSAFDDRPDLGLPKPVPGWVALVAALALMTGAVRLGREVRRRRVVLRELRRAGQPNDGLVVADWAEPLAVAVPGRPGHVLITSGMLRLLDGNERRVLFAHENSHLARHHHRWVSAAAWSAAVNPLLIQMARQVAHSVERWADEDAAAEVGDRRLVARAVAKASLASTGRRVAPAMGLQGSGAVQRVVAMQHPRERSNWRAVCAVAAICFCLVVSAAAAATEFVEVAHAWIRMVR